VSQRLAEGGHCWGPDALEGFSGLAADAGVLVIQGLDECGGRVSAAEVLGGKQPDIGVLVSKVGDGGGPVPEGLNSGGAWWRGREREDRHGQRHAKRNAGCEGEAQLTFHGTVLPGPPR
jgi:hypothetical protein